MAYRDEKETLRRRVVELEQQLEEAATLEERTHDSRGELLERVRELENEVERAERDLELLAHDKWMLERDLERAQTDASEVNELARPKYFDTQLRIWLAVSPALIAAVASLFASRIDPVPRGMIFALSALMISFVVHDNRSFIRRWYWRSPAVRSDEEEPEDKTLEKRAQRPRHRARVQAEVERRSVSIKATTRSKGRRRRR